MPINPAMLMLSAANPCLLPLAFEPDRSSALSGFGSSVRHHGNVTHEFAANSAERLQGYRVEAESAARTYAAGIAAFDTVVAELSEEIAEYDEKFDKQERKDNEHREEEYRKYKEKEEQMEAEKAELKKLPEMIKEVKINAKKSFWLGYSKEDLDKINALETRKCELEEKYSLLRYDPFDTHRFYNIMRQTTSWSDYRVAPKLESIRADLVDKQKVAEISVGTVPLSFDHARELAEINANPKAWATTTVKRVLP